MLILASVATVIAVNVYKEGKEISYITISTTPNRTEFFVGEKPNYEGLRINAVLKNGDSQSIDYTECVISGFDNSVATDKQTITVKYKEFTAKFDIKIKEAPKPTPTLKGISMQTLPKTVYKLGEGLDTNGGVILREYSDGSTKIIGLVNSYIVDWEDAVKAGPGTYTLTVKYKENSIIKQTTYDITIESPEATE